MKLPFKINKENGIILILVGVLCMVVVWPAKETSEGDKNASSSGFYDGSNAEEEDMNTSASLNVYVNDQEQRLRKILEQIDGVGKVEVMIRASASKAYIVEKDIVKNESTILETDSSGGTRNSTEEAHNEASIYTKDSKGNDIPLIVKELEPEIEGVLVAAQGGDIESLVSEITQAVQVLFDIPVHKIKVVKMKVD